MRSRLAAAGVALAITLAACGSDGDTAPSSTEGVATSGAGSTTPSAPDTAPPDTAPAGSAAPGSSDTPPAESDPPASTAAPAQPVTSDDVALDEVAELDEPIALATRSTEPDVVFVAERDGRLRRIALDGSGDEVVLDLRDDTTTEAERGLLGIAFHPEGTPLYVSFTDDDGNSRIDEYGVADDGTVDTESRRTVLTQDQPYPNHNGGHITFGPDEMLYFGLGDGGAANDPERSSLDASTLLGKLLRIDPTTPSGDLAYTVPDDNPFVGVDGARPEIWSIGLRNPWRFSFDRASGDLWIGDVGQQVWEEVDLSLAADGAGRGINFGWSAFEGNERFNDDQPDDGVTPPVYEYAHGDDGCSITGGFVYRGAAIPQLVGTYVFGDYCSGLIWGLQLAADGSATRIELAQLDNVVSFGEDASGELYAISLNGSVQRFTAPS